MGILEFRVDALLVARFEFLTYAPSVAMLLYEHALLWRMVGIDPERFPPDVILSIEARSL